MRYNYNPPGILKLFFNEWNWYTVNNKILFTFDDGPLPGNTLKILEALDKAGIKALFFCVGNNIEKNPELVQEILNRGHEIGNHTFNHRIISKITEEEVKQEISSVSNVVREKFGYEIKYFRPPHGRFDLATNRILTDTKLKNVMWSLLTRDYNNDIKVVKFAVSKYLRRNSIIVLHDSLRSKDIIIDSINYIADYAYHAGFEIGKPAECLK